MKAIAKKAVIFDNSQMTVNPELDKKYGDKVHFPEKVEQAKAFLEKKDFLKAGKLQTTSGRVVYKALLDGL